MSGIQTINRIGSRIKPLYQAVKRKAYLAIPPTLTAALYYTGAKLMDIPLVRRNNYNYPDGKLDNLYGAMESFGLWVGYEVAKEGAIKNGIEPKKASLAYLATGAGGILGAKALYLAQFHNTISDFTDILINAGGTWYGGVLGGMTALYLYAKASKLSFIKLLDALTPAGLIGVGIGRIGCWSAGCCPGEIFGLHTEPISAAFNIITGLWLTKIANSSTFKGKTFLLGISIYAAFRFIIEFFRHEPNVSFGFTLAQMISVGLLATAGIAYPMLSKKSKPQETIKSETLQTPRQKFKTRLIETLVFLPLTWRLDGIAATIIGITNSIRTLIAGIQWRKANKNKIDKTI